MKIAVAGLAATLGLSAFAGELQISSVSAKQRDLTTGLVDITFDVSSDSNTVSVILSAMNTATSQIVPMKAVFDTDGNFVGNPAKVTPATGKKLIWNSAVDLGKGFYSDKMVITARATEKDLPPSYMEKYLKTKEHYAKAVQALNSAELAYVNAQKANITFSEMQGGPWGEQTIIATGEKYTSDFSKADEALDDYKRNIELWDGTTVSTWDAYSTALNKIETSFKAQVAAEISFESAATPQDLTDFTAAVADYADKKTAILGDKDAVQDETTGLKNGIVGYTKASKAAAVNRLSDDQDDLADSLTKLNKLISDLGTEKFSTKEQKEFAKMLAKFNQDVDGLEEAQMAYEVAEDAAVDDVRQPFYLAEKSEDAGYAIYDTKAINAKQTEISDAQTAARKTWVEADEDFQQAETACLIVTGSKDGN